MRPAANGTRLRRRRPQRAPRDRDRPRTESACLRRRPPRFRSMTVKRLRSSANTRPKITSSEPMRTRVRSSTSVSPASRKRSTAAAFGAGLDFVAGKQLHQPLYRDLTAAAPDAHAGSGGFSSLPARVSARHFARDLPQLHRRQHRLRAHWRSPPARATASSARASDIGGEVRCSCRRSPQTFKGPREPLRSAQRKIRQQHRNHIMRRVQDDVARCKPPRNKHPGEQRARAGYRDATNAAGGTRDRLRLHRRRSQSAS